MRPLPPDDDDEAEPPERPPIRRLPKTRHGLPPPEDEEDAPESPLRRPEPEPTERRVSQLPWLASLLLQNIFTLLVLALVLGLFGLVWWARTSLDLSPANFDRIKDGMTEAEVARILGAAANAKPPVMREKDFPTAKSPPVWRAWQDGTTLVVLAFVDGKLHYKQRLTLFR
jgi:hypothetical protein